jgi:hypothetical protein
MQDLAAEHDRPGRGKLTEVVARICVIDDGIGRSAFGQSF